MRTKISLVALAVALLAAPALASDLTGSVTLAGRGASTKDNLNRAAEYRSTDGSATVMVDLTGAFDRVYLSLVSEVLDTNDQLHTLDLELDRTVRSHTTYTAMPHRLERDTLANLRGTVKEVVATWSTDLDPTTAYGIDYVNLANRTDLQFAELGWLTVSGHFRQQWREGHKQSMALSHCSTCHVQSQGRRVDELTRDAGISARAVFGGWSLVGGYSERDFRERGATPTRVYELVEQPAQRRPLFSDRAQYDFKDGALPYDLVPSSTKETGKLELANGNLGGFALTLTGVTSTTTNSFTDNEVEHTGVGLTLARAVGATGRFSFRARRYEIDSTDFFVDVVEPAAVAGTYPGQTYRQRYGFVPDFLRRSAIDREVAEAQARFAWRFPGAGTLTATYDVRDIDRESYEVAPGESDTLEQKLKLSYGFRPAKGVNLRAALTYADIERPFMILDAACVPGPLQTTPLASPLVPGSVQYYQIHAARVADLGASPASYLEARVSGTLQIGASGLASLVYRYWDGDNTELDLSDWSRSLSAVTATLSLAPAERWEVFAAATYGSRKTEQHVCIPLMDG